MSRLAVFTSCSLVQNIHRPLRYRPPFFRPHLSPHFLSQCNDQQNDFKQKSNNIVSKSTFQQFIGQRKCQKFTTLRLICTSKRQDAFSFRRASPWPPCCTPGPRWGLCPQTFDIWAPQFSEEVYAYDKVCGIYRWFKSLPGSLSVRPRSARQRCDLQPKNVHAFCHEILLAYTASWCCKAKLHICWNGCLCQVVRISTRTLPSRTQGSGPWYELTWVRLDWKPLKCSHHITQAGHQKHCVRSVNTIPIFTVMYSQVFWLGGGA